MEKSVLDSIIQELQNEKQSTARLRQRLAEGSEQFAETMETVHRLADLGKGREATLQKLLQELGTCTADSDARLKKVMDQNKVLMDQNKVLLEELAETKEMLHSSLIKQKTMTGRVIVRELFSIARNRAVVLMGIRGVRTFADFRVDITQLKDRKKNAAAADQRSIQNEIEGSERMFEESWTKIGLDASHLEDFKKLTNSINANHFHVIREPQDYQNFVDDLPDDLKQYRPALQQVMVNCFVE